MFRAHPDYKAFKWVGVKDGLSVDEAEGLPRMFLNTEKVRLDEDADGARAGMPSGDSQ